MKKLTAMTVLLGVLLGTVQAETPDRFIDYVETTGTQYIDTGVNANNSIKATLEFEWTGITADSCLLGCRKDGGDNRFFLVHETDSSKGEVSYVYGTFQRVKPGGIQLYWKKNQRYTVTSALNIPKSGSSTNLQMVIDGATVLNATTTTRVVPDVNLYLFAANYNGAQYFSKVKFYGGKIWKGGSLAREFRPCVKDNRAGLYDEVSKTIFYPQGGTFAVNTSPRVDMPDYFVAYVESSGSQFVDVEVAAKSGTRMDTTMMWVEVPSDGCYLGARASNQAPNADSRLYPYYYWQSQLLGYGKYYHSGQTVTAGQKMRVKSSLAAGAQTLKVDGVEILTLTESEDLDYGLNMYLFALHFNYWPAYPVKARCYGLKIWQTVNSEERLVRDLRPCVKDGRGCLYDQVSQRIFHAREMDERVTGSLAYPELTEEELKPVCRVEYVESDGQQFVDLGVTVKAGTAAQFKMAWTDSANSQDAGFLGARKNAGTDSRFYLWYAYQGKMAWAYNYFKSPGADVYPGVEIGRVYDVRSSFLNNYLDIAVDGATVVHKDAEYSTDFETSLYLFALNIGGDAQYHAKARCYSLKIWQDGELVRDLVPVRLKCGLAGLWDRLDDTVYLSESGNLTAGPDAGPLVPGMVLTVR